MIFETAPLTFGQENTQQLALQYYSKGRQTNDLSEKIKYFERAIELAPDFGEASYRLGICYFRKGDFKNAITSLTRVHPVDTASYDEAQLYLRNAYTFYAQQLIKQESFEAAYTTAAAAIEMGPEYAPALSIFGLAQFQLRDWKGAIETLEKSLRLDSEQENAWNTLGDAYMRVEDYPGAIEAYEHALRINPDLKDASYHINIATQRNRPELWLRKYEQAMKAGDTKVAKRYLERTLASDPGNKTAKQKLTELEQESHYTAAKNAISEEEWEIALTHLQQLDENFKDSADLREKVQRAITGEEQAEKTPVRKVSKARTSGTSVARSDKSKTQGSEKTNSKGARENTNAALVTSKTKLAEKSEALQSPVPDDMIILRPDDGSDSESILMTQMEESLLDSQENALASNQLPGAVDDFENQSATPRSDRPADSEGGFSSIWIWLFATVGCVCAGFIFYRFRRETNARPPRNPWLESTLREGDVSVVPPMRLPGLHASRQDAEDNETFQDDIASQTPITFDPVDTSNIFEKKKEDGPSPEDTLFYLQETQTIQGGIRRVRRIGRYVIEKEIGRGSMGLVFKAWDPKLDRTVVIKQVAFFGHQLPTEIERLKDRLYREARAAGKLNHPNIVIIYDVEEENNSSFIVMEHLQGDDLKTIIDQEGIVEPVRATKITAQICQALDFAHKNDIVHRDIKPSNIILLENDKVKVADFGIAKLPQLGTLTRTGDVIGTPFYMSPEQIEGRKVDGRSDVFSTGVLLYEMVTGIRPFDGDTIPSVVYKIVNITPSPASQENKDVPPEFDLILNRALAKDPGERFQSAREFMHELRKLQGEIASNEV